MNCETRGRDVPQSRKTSQFHLHKNYNKIQTPHHLIIVRPNFDPNFSRVFFSVAQDVPQIQYVDKIVEVPVQKQRHVPVVQKVPKIVELPTLEYVDHVVHVPITQHRHVPVVQTVKKHVEVPVVKYEVGRKQRFRGCLY